MGRDGWGAEGTPQGLLVFLIGFRGILRDAPSRHSSGIPPCAVPPKAVRRRPKKPDCPTASALFHCAIVLAVVPLSERYRLSVSWASVSCPVTASAAASIACGRGHSGAAAIARWSHSIV